RLSKWRCRHPNIVHHRAATRSIRKSGNIQPVAGSSDSTIKANGIGMESTGLYAARWPESEYGFSNWIQKRGGVLHWYFQTIGLCKLTPLWRTYKTGSPQQLESADSQFTQARRRLKKL